MLVPEKFGGGTVSGSAMTELALVAEELGRACAPGPFVTTTAVLAGLAGTAERFGEVVTAVAGGETIVTWAVYEPGRGFDALAPAAGPRGGSLPVTEDQKAVAIQIVRCFRTRS
jgi:alkylation response protein AidB-like acyl-CoA dehydrogenase